MAVISFTAASVAPIQVDSKFTAPAAVTITAGQLVRIAPTSGSVHLASAAAASTASCVGMALNDAVSGQAVTVLEGGLVDYPGGGLSDLNFMAQIYLGDTDGAASAGKGTVLVEVGNVRPIKTAFQNNSDKVFRLSVSD